MMKGFSYVPSNKFLTPPRVVNDDNVVIQGVNIKAGFSSDGASVPWWLPLFGIALLIAAHWYWLLFIPAVVFTLSLALFPRFGLSFKAAFLHDYLLKRDVRRWWNAGVLFYRQMLDDKVPIVIAWLAWLFVTLWQLVFSLIRLVRFVL